MEQYVWMAIGCIIVGFFAKTYWDVYRAYRAYMATLTEPGEQDLAGVRPARPAQESLAGWLLDKGDRALHVMLMSPISR